MSIVTLWALFGDDIRVLAVSRTGDTAFYILTIICFSIFSVEILLSCYAKSDYLFTFFFWLDLISTVTLLLDVGWVSDALYGTSSDSAGGSQNSQQIAKAAKASQVGTRAARVIRIIRLIRLIRIVKLYKAAEKERIKKEKEEKDRKKRERNEIRKKLASMGAPADSRSQVSGNPQNPELKSLSNEHIVDKHNESDDGQPPANQRRPSESSDPLEAQLPGKGGKNAVMPVSLPKEKESKESAKSDSKAFNVSKTVGPSSNSEFNEENIKFDEDELQEQVKESNVGKELISNITKIVIVLILMIMFSVALFTSDTYLNDDYDAQRALLRQLER